MRRLTQEIAKLDGGGAHVSLCLYGDSSVIAVDSICGVTVKCPWKTWLEAVIRPPHRTQHLQYYLKGGEIAKGSSDVHANVHGVK